MGSSAQSAREAWATRLLDTAELFFNDVHVP